MTEQIHHDALAQQAGEEALAKLWEDGEEGYCTCDTCTVREILTAAYEHLLSAAQEQLAEVPADRTVEWVPCAVEGCVTSMASGSGYTKCSRHRLADLERV